MGKKILLLAVVLVIVCLCSWPAFALDPMGPPTAGLKKGQYSAGVDYLYEDGKLKLKDVKVNGNPESSITMKVKVHMVTANIGYGITDNWEAFLRLGSGVSGKAKGDTSSDKIEFDGDSGFVIGFGTKATFYEASKLKLGGLFQMSWSDVEGDMKHIYNGTAPWSADVQTIEMQFAVGPTYKLTENSIWIYGGPFFYFIDGDADAKYSPTLKLSSDVDEVGCFGGYIGTLIDITKNISYSIEYQHTAADNALGMYLGWKF